MFIIRCIKLILYGKSISKGYHPVSILNHIQGFRKKLYSKSKKYNNNLRHIGRPKFYSKFCLLKKYLSDTDHLQKHFRGHNIFNMQ